MSNKRPSLVEQKRGNLLVLEKLDDKVLYGKSKPVSFRVYRCKSLKCGNECIKNSLQLSLRHDARVQKELSCGCDIGETHIVNARVNSNNTSGVKGISWISEKEKWRAEIQYKGKRYYLAKSKNIEYLHMAPSDGRLCGAKRPRCVPHRPASQEDVMPRKALDMSSI